MKNEVWGYARVSTKEQNLARQIEQLKEFGISERNIKCDKISGKTFNRMEYNALVGTETTAPTLREGDLLVIVSLDRLGRNYTENAFCNKENVLNVIRENVSADERAELDDACNEAIEYRKLHYNDLKDEIEDLLQVVREFVVKPDYMNELLQALTNVVNTFADRGDIDYEAVIKLADIIPIMQRLDSKDVAKAIVEEFHNEKVLSQVVSKPSTKSNKGRKPKTEFTVEKGEKTE